MYNRPCEKLISNYFQKLIPICLNLRLRLSLRSCLAYHRIQDFFLELIKIFPAPKIHGYVYMTTLVIFELIFFCFKKYGNLNNYNLVYKL